MKIILITLASLGVLTGCHHVASQTWRASEANGDKPGVGFELKRAKTEITGTAYLLDPNFPHDFSHGVKRDMTLLERSPLTIDFRVEWNTQTKETLRFSFNKSDWPDTFSAVVTEVGGKEASAPQTYTFRKTK